MTDGTERLRDDCAELYQVIGALRHLALEGKTASFEDFERALDNACAAADGEPRPHADLLPFPRRIVTVAEFAAEWSSDAPCDGSPEGEDKPKAGLSAKHDSAVAEGEAL